ncbi:MAG: hypothetical protein HRT99_03810 [Mycoplasmatales bacterium]|nr:hypothetical protein [Mycoplasmatales bacterium]
MKKRNRKKNKRSEIGFFKSLNLDNKKPDIVGNFVFEIQKNSSNTLKNEIFDEDSKIQDIEIWLVIDSKIDITLNKVKISMLKKVFLVSPVAILKVRSTYNGIEEITNILVKDLFVVRKNINSDVYVRFSENFEIISEEVMIKKYKEIIASENGETYLDKLEQKTINLISREQKRIVNEQYTKVQRHYKMTKDKEYDVNIFNKMDYHTSRISVLQEFLYNEIIKSMVFSDEFSKIAMKRGEYEK